MTLEGCIGLEIHIALKTKTKLFCSCPLESGGEPNEHVCPVCLGHPGVLPRLNRGAVEQGLKIVTAMGMTAPAQLRFDRKHYVYPDLSKNFQTSQFYFTLGRGGSIDFKHAGRDYTIAIAEAHLEEDAAKLIHQNDESMVDYNRGGTPLLEMVTEPVLQSGEEAEILLRNLQLLLRRIDASEANMELAQMRCDANVSVSPDGKPTGTRVEIKNINSPRFVKNAIEYEIKRQQELLARGGRAVQETRLWNENRGITESMRSKESAHDYRYLPEPDLPVVTLPPELIESTRRSLPELPEKRIARYGQDYGLSYQEGWCLISEPELERYFLEATKLNASASSVYTWLNNQVAEVLKESGNELPSSSLSPEKLAEVIKLKKKGKISSTSAKLLLKLIIDTGKQVPELLEEYSLRKVTDESQIKEWISAALSENSEAVTTYLGGKETIFAFLKGQALKAGRGMADPALVHILLERELASMEVSK